MRLGALEAGGTKMVCAVGDETGKVFDRISIPTKSPSETMPEMIAYFKEKEIEALGIGCFGPIDPDPKSPTYGYILSTPKLEWQNFDMVGAFEKALQIPVGFDTDVNASALGEATYGAAKGLDCSMYLTVGTGIGAGIYMDLSGENTLAGSVSGGGESPATSGAGLAASGGLLHGMLHPEAGHIMMKRHPADTYEGKCPFHKDCFEGLAAGPAIEARWGKKAADLADKPEVWEMEAYYIAQALVNYTMILSPRRIVLGGGVMHQKQLYPLIRKYFKHMMADYVKTKELDHLEEFIVPYSLDDNQGIMGCLQLALRKLALDNPSRNG